MLKLNDEKLRWWSLHQNIISRCTEVAPWQLAMMVSPSHRIRNLGVHMDQHLTMPDHVTAVCAACNYHLYRLPSTRHYLTNEAAKSAVNALVTSRLDSLLYNIPLSQRARLQCVQNNAARQITRTSKHDHITPLLKELHWLPVESRIAFKMVVMTFKCISSVLSCRSCSTTKAWRTPILRQNYAPTLHQGITKKYFGDSAFDAAAHRLWNEIPVHPGHYLCLESL